MLLHRRRRLTRVAEDEKGERADPRLAHVSKAAWIFCRSSRLTMSLRTSSDSDSMPSASIQQPGALEPLHERRIGEIVGAGVAEPLDRQVARDQLVAEGAERFHVQRDGVAPQVEELDPELPVAALDLVDERLRAALAELVALVDRRDAEVTRVGTAAAGFDDDVALVHERQRVAIERDQIPCRVRHGGEAGEAAMGAMRNDRPPALRQVRLGTSASLSIDGELRELQDRRLPARRRTCRPLPGRAPSSRAAAVEACGPKQNIGAPYRRLDSRDLPSTSASSVGVVLREMMSVGRSPRLRGAR